MSTDAHKKLFELAIIRSCDRRMLLLTRRCRAAARWLRSEPPTETTTGLRSPISGASAMPTRPGTSSPLLRGPGSPILKRPVACSPTPPGESPNASAIRSVSFVLWKSLPKLLADPLGPAAAEEVLAGNSGPAVSTDPHHRPDGRPPESPPHSPPGSPHAAVASRPLAECLNGSSGGNLDQLS